MREKPIASAFVGTDKRDYRATLPLVYPTATGITSGADVVVIGTCILGVL